MKKIITFFLAICIFLNCAIYGSINVKAQTKNDFTVLSSSISFLDDYTVEKFVNLFYESESAIATEIEASLKGQSKGTYELFKDMLDKVLTFYGVIDNANIEDVISSAASQILKDTSLCFGIINGVLSIYENATEFVHSTNAVKKTIDGFKALQNFMKIIGCSQYFPSSLSLVLTASNIGLCVGSYLETEYFKEAAVLYEYELILAYWSGGDLPQKEAPKIFTDCGVTQEEADSIFAQLYMKYLVQRMLDGLSNSDNIEKDDASNEDKYDIVEQLNIEDIEYSVQNNFVTIEKYIGIKEKYLHVALPSEIDGLPVIAISEYAFENINYRSIIIPDSVREIRDYAFYGNPSFDRIIILGKETQVSSSAFNWEMPTSSNLIANQTIGNVPIYCEDNSLAREFAENNQGYYFKSLDWDGATIWGIAPQNNVYYVHTAQQLAYIAYLVNNGNSLNGYTVQINNDIHLNNCIWTPIGNTEANYFSGSFLGKNHVIDGINISNNALSALFGYVKGNNITFSDVIICGNISGYYNSSGLIGNLSILSNGDFLAKNILNKSNITNTDSGNAGGLIATINSNGNCRIELTECRNYGVITNTGGWGPRNVGGLVGCITSTNTDTYQFFGCYQESELNQRASSGYSSGAAGGLIAIMNGGNLNVAECAIIGKISAQAYGPNCGGLIGYISPHSFLIENCEIFSTLISTHNAGDSNVAGLIGGCSSENYNSFSELIIKNTYISASMTGAYGKAALVINQEQYGYSLRDIMVQNCYFDTSKTSIGTNRMLAWTFVLSGCNTISDNVYNSGTYSSTQLKTEKSLYANWDMDGVWEYGSCGYPKLRRFMYENHSSTSYKYEVNSFDDTKHDKMYSCCSTVIETVEHIYDRTKYDSSYHWQACICNHTLSKLEHSVGDWITQREPTCINEGRKYRKCENCDYREYLSIPAIGHTYSNWTSYNSDQHKMECACGKDTLYADHDWNEGEITIEATHTALGVKTYLCIDCGEVKSEDIEKIKDHNYSNWKGHNFEEHKKVCSCGDVQYNYHIWNDGVITSPATHTMFGIKTYTCLECGTIYTEAIEKFTEHNYRDWENHDSTKHKKICPCGDIQYADHFFSIDNNSTCQHCGFVKTENSQGSENDGTTEPLSTESELATNDALTEVKTDNDVSIGISSFGDAGCGSSISSECGIILFIFLVVIEVFSKKQTVSKKKLNH